MQQHTAIRLPIPLLKSVRKLAKADGTNISTIIRDAVKREVERRTATNRP